MAKKVIWSEPFNQSLEDILEYIASDSPNQANLFFEKVYDLVKTIGQFPDAGREVPEYQKPEIQERILKGYRLIYRLRSNYIDLLAMIHGSRQLPDLLNN